jgi:hypothetical protein
VNEFEKPANRPIRIDRDAVATVRTITVTARSKGDPSFGGATHPLCGDIRRCILLMFLRLAVIIRSSIG